MLDVLKGVYEAWEANDAEAFVADYLDDASVVQPGVYKKDRQEIQATMAGGFAGPLKGSRDRPTPRRPVPQRGHGHRHQRGRDRLSRTELRAEPGHGPGHLGASQAQRPLVCRGVPLQRRELAIGVRGGFRVLWEADSCSRGWPDRVRSEWVWPKCPVLLAQP